MFFFWGTETACLKFQDILILFFFAKIDDAAVRSLRFTNSTSKTHTWVIISPAAQANAMLTNCAWKSMSVFYFDGFLRRSHRHRDVPGKSPLGFFQRELEEARISMRSCCANFHVYYRRNPLNIRIIYSWQTSTALWLQNDRVSSAKASLRESIQPHLIWCLTKQESDSRGLFNRADQKCVYLITYSACCWFKPSPSPRRLLMPPLRQTTMPRTARIKDSDTT